MPLPAQPLAEPPTAQPAAKGLTLTQLAWLTPLTAILIALQQPTQDNSYLWHVEAGLRQIDRATVFTTDPFTFTAVGESWRTQSWLIELVYGWLEGIKPLVSAPLVVGLSAVTLLLAVGLRVARGRGILGPIATLWVMWLVLGYFTARPVFPSLALFAVLTLVADRKRLRWSVPLLFWVWASVHGGFFIGLGYLLLQGIRHKDRRALLDALAGAGAASLTAHGLGVWSTLVTFAASSSNLDLISEWRPPDFVSLAHLPFLLAIVALLWLAVAGKVDRRDLWLVIPFILFAFMANRSVALAALAIVPFVFPVTEIKAGQMAFSRPLTALVLLLVVTAPVLVEVNEDLFEEKFPVEAIKHMAEVRTFHDDSAGGYLIYAGFPLVFIDDRAELFGELYQRFVDARDAKPGWDELFAEYEFKQALLRTEDPIRSVLELSGWTTVFEDDEFIVLAAADSNA